MNTGMFLLPESVTPWTSIGIRRFDAVFRHSPLKSTQIWALNHALFGSFGILGLLDVDGFVCFVDSACRPSSIATDSEKQLQLQLR
jgi:hypothetical protein